MKRFISWLFKKQVKQSQVNPWHQYCIDNPHAPGCRLYEV